MGEKQKGLDFSDMSGGKNSVDPQHALAKNEVRESKNIIHEKIGCSRAPGYRGISSTALLTAQLLGQFTYKHGDGTETLIEISDAKIYSIDTAAGEKTELGAFTGSGEAFAVNAAGKLWIVNGTSFVKIEDDLSVYPVQIAAPEGTSAAKLAGGSIPDGVYGCYVSYARKDANDKYLYSLPFSLGDVTLSGGDNSIKFTIPNPTDDQITHKVFWMTDAGGAVPYYYGETDDDDAIYDLTDATGRNSLIRMDVNAAANQILPITPAGIFHFDDRLIVWDDYTFYWSMKTDVNPFDLERFLAENFRTVTQVISSMFSVPVTPDQTDLFINSVKTGVFRIPRGDFTAVIKRIQQSFWFRKANVPEGRKYVVDFNNLAWGFTNDGIRHFNGFVFSDDLSYKIKDDMARVYTGIGAGFDPAMIIFRRERKRTELRFSYRDLTIGATTNNRQLVFNIDFYFNPMESKRTWETWENGFYSYTIFNENIICAQRLDNGVICEEIGVADEKAYNPAGAFITPRTAKEIYIFTRTRIPRLDAITVWGSVYALVTASGTIKGNYVLFDASNTKVPFNLVGQPAGLAILPADGEGGLAMPIILTGQFPTANIETMPFDANSYSIAIELRQTQDDPDFRIYNIQLPKASAVFNNLT